MSGIGLPIAALGEIVGQQRVFVAGIAVFTAASLVAARVFQGLGASAVMAVKIALVRFVYPAHQLGRGVGLNAFVGGVCFVAGPTVASLILVAPWPWLFAGNVPIGFGALALALTALPDTRQACSAGSGLRASAPAWAYWPPCRRTRASSTSRGG